MEARSNPTGKKPAADQPEDNQRTRQPMSRHVAGNAADAEGDSTTGARSRQTQSTAQTKQKTITGGKSVRVSISGDLDNDQDEAGTVAESRSRLRNTAAETAAVEEEDVPTVIHSQLSKYYRFRND